MRLGTCHEISSVDASYVLPGRKDFPRSQMLAKISCEMDGSLHWEMVLTVCPTFLLPKARCSCHLEHVARSDM